MPTHAHTSMPHSLGSPEGVISKKNVSQMEMFSSYLRQLVPPARPDSSKTAASYTPGSVLGAEMCGVQAEGRT